MAENVEELKKLIEKFKENLKTTNGISESLTDIETSLEKIEAALQEDASTVKGESEKAIAAIKDAQGKANASIDSLSQELKNDFEQIWISIKGFLNEIEKQISRMEEEDKKLKDSFSAEVKESLEGLKIDDLKAQVAGLKKSNNVLLIAVVVTAVISLVTLIMMFVK